MKSRASVVMNIIGGILVLAGLAVVLYSAYVRSSTAQVETRPQFTAANSTRPQVSEPDAIEGEPSELSIPSLGISNQVIGGVFDADSQKWTLTLDKVQHAVQTYQPNNKHGMTYMYGHNRKEVFAHLPSIEPGAIAVVKTTNGHTFRYRFTGSRVTSPDDVSVFAYLGPPKLVLQTCVGLFYENRQLFTFELIGVDHA